MVWTEPFRALAVFQKKDQQLKQQEKSNYYKRHRVHTQPPLAQDEAVWVHTKDHVEPGCIVQPAVTPWPFVHNPNPVNDPWTQPLS